MSSYVTFLNVFRYKKYGRIAVIGEREFTTTIPEFSNLPSWWNTRARGLGGMLSNPISTGGEENLLCKTNDRYYGDDIFFHESAHSVAEVALMGGAMRGMYQKIGQQHARVKNRLWRGTYSYTDQREYFAEALQSFHNCHTEKRQAGVHNHINTRAELRTYDPGMFRLLKQIYPCMNTYHWCRNKGSSKIRLNCNADGSGGTTGGGGGTGTGGGGNKKCEDKETGCKAWEKSGYCTGKHAVYMKENCCASCKTGGGGGTGTGGGGGNSCTDKHNNCKSWATGGFCTDATQKKYMKENCCAACKNVGGGGGKSNCVNKHKNCNYWKGQGYCTDATQKQYMKDNCCASCKGTGGTTGGGSCSDSDGRCPGWARRGECARNPGYMHTSCKKSCNKC